MYGINSLKSSADSQETNFKQEGLLSGIENPSKTVTLSNSEENEQVNKIDSYMNCSEQGDVKNPIGSQVRSVLTIKDLLENRKRRLPFNSRTIFYSFR